MESNLVIQLEADPKMIQEWLKNNFSGTFFSAPFFSHMMLLCCFESKARQLIVSSAYCSSIQHSVSGNTYPMMQYATSR
jgi:hypothetical protein